MRLRGEDNGVYGYCWLAQFSDKPCDGRLRKCHLIPRRLILREVPAEVAAGAVWDPRCWIWACGGPTGVSGHHGMLDTSRTLRIPRSHLPAELEDFAAEHRLTWWLDRTYGTTGAAA
jgi:hypothetical protein